MHAITVPINLPRYAGTGYGSELVGLPTHDSALFTYFEGKAATRLAHVHLRTGDVFVVKGVSGMLMDGVASERYAYLLSEYALHEYDIEAREVVRRLKVPKEMHHIDSPLPGTLAVSRSWSNVTIFIDISSWAVVSRVAFPIDFFILDGGTLLACSFQNGFARALDASLKPYGEKRPVPLARHLTRCGDRIFAIKGPPAPGEVSEPLRATRLVRIHPETLAIEEEREIRGIQAIFGADPEGRIILGSATGVVLADAATLAPIAEARAPERITAAARVGERSVALAGDPQFLHGLHVYTWSASTA